jgi:hypothetical protein
MFFSRTSLLLFAAISAAVAGSSAIAEPSGGQSLGTIEPPNGHYVGTTDRTVAYGTNGWCAVELGPSTLLRIGSDEAIIGFAGVNYFNGEHYQLSGDPKFDFVDEKSGKVRFDYPRSFPKKVRRIKFKGYQETYRERSRRLKVSFELVFSDCVVPVEATYRH